MWYSPTVLYAEIGYQMSTFRLSKPQKAKKGPLAGIYGANRDRTGDLLLAKQVLSQLS
jgi:hypothetical protein